MSSNFRNNSERRLYELRLNNKYSKGNNIKNSNKILITNLKNNLHEGIMKRENLLETKLNFKPIFEKINKNKRKYNHSLLNNFEQNEKDLRKIISLDVLLNFIYQSGIPYKIDFKKKIKQNLIKKNLTNIELEKKEKIIEQKENFNEGSNIPKKRNLTKILNKNKERNISPIINIISKKSGISQNISAKKVKNIFIKNLKNNKIESKLIKGTKLNTKINDNIKSETNIKKNHSIFIGKDKYRKNLINSFPKLNSKDLCISKSLNFRNFEKKINLPNNILINTESKKLINSQVLNNMDFINSEDKIKTHDLINLENMKTSSSEILFKKEFYRTIINKKPKKNLRILLLGNNTKKKEDIALKNFKNSITDLNSFFKTNFNSNTISENNCDYYSEEEQKELEKQKIEKISKNLEDLNDKIRKSINYYEKVMNKRSFTERNKNDSFKIIKMFSNLGKKTINKMATNLDICQHHFKEQLINVIDDYSSSYKKRNYNNLDPTLEIIINKKIKKEESNQLEYDDYDHYIKDNNNIDYQKKELNRMGELIGKINHKVAFDLSNYLLLYNKNLGNKVKEINDENKKRINKNKIKYLKKSIEYQLYNLRRLKQRNIFEYNKVIHKFNDFYTKIKNEKKFNEEYRKLIFLNNI